MIFNIVKNQLIVSMAGVVDINHMPIYESMALYQIKNKRQCFEKVALVLGRWLVGRLNKKD